MSSSYTIIKLFKIVDSNQAEGFQMKEAFNLALGFLEESKTSSPKDFEINYGQKCWSSKNGFEKSISKMRDSNVFTASAYYDNSKAYVDIDNGSLNYITRPVYSSILIKIALEKELYDQQKAQVIIAKINKLSSLDYGYIVNLTSAYDFHTERKIKRSLLGSTIEVTTQDQNWNFRMVGVKYGFIKKLYPVNFVNKTHLKQPILAGLIEEGVAKFDEIVEGLYQLTFANDDLEKSKELLNRSKYVIDNENQFLDSEEAKKFYDMMKVPN